MKILRVIVSFVLSALILMAGFGLPHAALAQTPTEGINLQISPLPIELSTKPGTSVTKDLRVRNGGSQDEQLQLRLLSVSEDSSGNVHLNNPGPAAEWVHWV